MNNEQYKNHSIERIDGEELILWPFDEAKKILDQINYSCPKKGYVLFATGYGPSGLPHIGTFGEVVRTAAVRKAFSILAPSIPTKIIAFSDDMDGLRKVPDNIPNRDMVVKHLHKPLIKIPDPFGTDQSYGHHMNRVFCEFLDSFGFEYEFCSSSANYFSGRYNDCLIRILDIHNYEKIMTIMLDSLREERQQTYSPFLPISVVTDKVLQVPIRINYQSKSIEYTDPDTGEEIVQEVTDGKCKLQWKPDWGMRWIAFDVDYEMHGKDITPSATLSRKIALVIGDKCPITMQYEMFLDEDGKKISKSKGNGLTIEQWLRYGPIESLKLYMLQQPKRQKRLYFDVIPKAVDEYIKLVELYHSSEDLPKSIKSHDSNDHVPTLSQLNNLVWYVHNDRIPNINAFGLSYSLLLNLANICNPENKDIMWNFIARYVSNDEKFNDETIALFNILIQCAINYYYDFIKPNKIVYQLSDNERSSLQNLRKKLIIISEDNLSTDQLQNLVFEAAKESGYNKSNMKEWFELLYKSILGQLDGPRMGTFIKLYGIDKIIDKLHEIC